MEQEPERRLPLDTLRRVGYSLRLGAHLAFLVGAFTFTVVLLGLLFLD